MEGIADLTSPWGSLSLKLGKGSKHCTREHCKVGRRLAARVAVGGSRASHVQLPIQRFELQTNHGEHHHAHAALTITQDEMDKALDILDQWIREFERNLV